jgi:hypothetical protein
MADLQHPSDTTGRLIAASSVIGSTVFDLAGAKLGTIHELMLEKQSGRTPYAIMNFGGLFGIGQRHHPLPWHVLRYDPVLGGYVVDLDRSTLEGAPAFDSSDAKLWGDDSWGTRVDDYYGPPTHDDIMLGAGANPLLGSRAPLM